MVDSEDELANEEELDRESVPKQKVDNNKETSSLGSRQPSQSEGGLNRG